MAGGGGDDHLVDDALGLEGVLFQPVTDALADGTAHDAGDFAVAELALGLSLKLGLGHLHGYDGGQALTEVLAADFELQLFEQAAVVAVLREQPVHGAAEAVDVGTSLAGFDVIDEGVDVLLVGRVVLHGHLDLHVVFLGLHVNGLLDQVLLALVEVLNHLGEATFAVEFFAHGLTVVVELPLVGEAQHQSAVEKSEFLHAAGQRLVLVDNAFEDRSVRLEHDRRAGVVARADFVHLVLGLALAVILLIDLAIAVDGGPQVARQRVDAAHAYPVQTAGDFVGVFIELTARVEDGHNDLQGALL